jgi:predicted peroxiredoxin
LDPTGKQVLIIASTGPEIPDRCTAPFFFASEAARKGAKVSICFILNSACLLKKGVAETLYARENGRPLSDFILLALKTGVEFYICDAALQVCTMTPEDLIDEVENLVGPSFLITRGLDADLVLNF